MLADHLVIAEIYFESLEKERKIRDKGTRDFFFYISLEINRKYLVSFKGLKVLW